MLGFVNKLFISFQLLFLLAFCWIGSKIQILQNCCMTKGFYQTELGECYLYLFILSILQEYSVQITFRQQWCDDRLSYAGRLNHGDMRGNYKLIIQLHTKLTTRFHEVFFETVVNSFFSKIYWGDLTFNPMSAVFCYYDVHKCATGHSLFCMEIHTYNHKIIIKLCISKGAELMTALQITSRLLWCCWPWWKVQSCTG